MTATSLGLNNQPIKFLGAYLVNTNSQLGLAQSPSTCSITLAEDLNVSPNVLFDEPEVGTYQTLSIGPHFQFSGIVTSWSKDVRNISGRTISVNLSDPREIMSSVPMILAPGFRGVLDQVRDSQCSVLDVYGAYDDYDNTGVNLSGWNQAGISYEKILLALKGGTVIISDVTFNVIGQAAKAFGETYRFNLDDLSTKISDPTLRVNTNLISLADFIQEICQRNSLDWYVTSSRASDGYIDVVVHSIDRTLDNVDISLNEFLAANSGFVIDARIGYELRNEVACSVLFGAPREQMRTLNITGLANNPVDLFDEGGHSKYFMTEDEMRYVLGNKQAWILWLSLNGGLDRYNVGGIQQVLQTPIVDANGFTDVNSQLGINPNRGRPGLFPDQEKRMGQIYEKLKGHASASYGKRFLFQTPTDVDFIDSAWTVDVISGNNDPNEYFRKEDGKTRCYVEFVRTDILVASAPTVGFTVGKGEGAAQALSLELAGDFRNTTSVVELDKADWIRSSNFVNGGNAAGDRLYVAATIEEGGIVRIDTPVVEAAPSKQEVQARLEGLKSTRSVADAEGNTTGKGRRATARLIHIFGEYGPYQKIHSKAYQPRYVHVPVRSKFNRYGPVFSSNIGVESQGRLSIEQDDGFSPWEFGTEALMAQAMQFKVDNESSSVKKVESGTISIEGYPRFSIGDALGFNSNINGISVNLQGQVSTTYELRSFLRKFGELSKQELAQLSLFARRGGVRNIPQDTLQFLNKYRSKIAKNFAGRGNSSTSAIDGGALSFE